MATASISTNAPLGRLPTCNLTVVKCTYKLQTIHLHGSPGREVLLEEHLVNIVNSVKVIDVCQEDRGLDHTAECRPSNLLICHNIPQCTLHNVS